MIQYKLCALGFSTLILRFYLAMFGAIAIGFVINIYLAAIFAFAVSITAILGLKVKFNSSALTGKVILKDMLSPS